MSNPNFVSYICQKDILRATWIPTYKLPKFSRLCNQVLGIQGKHNISPKTTQILHPAVPILQYITKKPSETVYLNLRKASVIRVMAILPNSCPSIGWRRGYLTTNYIKEIFDVGELRYSRTATIKLWRQHLGAQLPGTLPQPLNVRRHQEQCSHQKTIGTIPRYPRDPRFFFFKSPPPVTLNPASATGRRVLTLLSSNFTNFF